jgi:hypothetical protein
MSSGPEGEKTPSRQGRIYDGICADSCVIQEPLDVAGGSIYDNANASRSSFPNRSKWWTSPWLFAKFWVNGGQDELISRLC